MIINLSNPAHLFIVSFIAMSLLWMAIVSRDPQGKVDAWLLFLPFISLISFGAFAVISLFQLIIKSL